MKKILATALFSALLGLPLISTSTSASTVDGYQWLTECESWEQRPGDCRERANGRIIRVVTIHKKSKNRCIVGESIHFSGNRLTVTNGCRANIEVLVERYVPPRPAPEVTCTSLAGRSLYLGRMSPEGVAMRTAPSGNGMWAVSGCERGRGCRLMMNCFSDNAVINLRRAGKGHTLDFRHQSICQFNGPAYTGGKYFDLGAGKKLAYCSVN